MNNFWWIAIVLTIIGAIIDAYYLALEKIYVNKYNDFISNLNFNNNVSYISLVNKCRHCLRTMNTYSTNNTINNICAKDTLCCVY